MIYEKHKIVFIHVRKLTAEHVFGDLMWRLHTFQDFYYAKKNIPPSAIFDIEFHH